MVKIGIISRPEVVTSYAYTTYSDPQYNCYIDTAVIDSVAVALSPSYVLVSSVLATNAIGKARTPLTAVGYPNYLYSKAATAQVGLLTVGVSVVNSVTLVKGLGTEVSVGTISSTAVTLFGSIIVKFNPIFIPNVIDIEISNRGPGELDNKQKVGTEVLGGQEFNNSLNIYASVNGIVDNISPVQSKILTKNILDQSKPKDRRNVIKSFVNHYSDAGKRI